MLWGLAEATLFFVVPDVLISAVALRRGLRAGLLAGLLAAVGAAAGGAVMVGWSARDHERAVAIVERVPAIPAGAVDDAVQDLQREGWPAALAGAFRGAPFKVWSVAAPRAGWSAGGWALAAFPIRLPRFLLIAAVFAALGVALRQRLSRVALTALFAAGWAAFYALFWLLSAW